MDTIFSRCKECGIIFHNPEGKYEKCPKCRDDAGELSERDTLRLIRNTVRDFQAKGEFVTVKQLVNLTGVSEKQIWHFIKNGDLDTASFSDPQVREYIVRRRRELSRAVKGKEASQSEKPEAPPARSSGFHMKRDDDSGA